MNIQDSNPEYLRAEQLKSGRATGTEGGTKDMTQPAQTGARTDPVQISDAGRALAVNKENSAPLSAERLAEIRQRILAGSYDSLDYVERVARRILASGDLDRRHSTDDPRTRAMPRVLRTIDPTEDPP